MLSYANLAAIKRYWAVILALSVVGAISAFLISLTITPLYKATASLYFTLNFGNTASDLAQGSTYTSNQMLSFGELATAPVVLEPVIQKLNLDMSVDDLTKVVDVSTPRDTVIMQISVTSVSPQSAAEIANAIGTQAGTVIEEYAPQMQNGKPSVQVRTIAAATPPQFQFVPDKKLNTAAGFVLGALLGVLAAFILAAIDNKIRSAQSLARITSVPYLGTLRQLTDDTQHAIVLHDRAGKAAEEYRQVRSSLRFSTMSKHPLSLVVSSSVPGEGKTTVATNLALALAESGQRVLLIDADLRKPRIAEYTNLIDSIGLSEVLVDEAKLSDAIQPLGLSGVDVLTAGSIPPNPGELVSSSRMAQLLREADAGYDVVIMDSAPILAVADALSLTQASDGILLVTRAGVTHKSDLTLSVDHVTAAGGTVFGIVINAGRIKSERALRDYRYGIQPDEDDATQPATPVLPARALADSSTTPEDEVQDRPADEASAQPGTDEDPVRAKPDDDLVDAAEQDADAPEALRPADSTLEEAGTGSPRAVTRRRLQA